MTSWCIFLSVGTVGGKKVTRDWERRQIEISSAANTLALCTQLVCLTALCTGSWSHCTHARVVLTPSECMHTQPFPPSFSLSVPLHLVFSGSLSRSHKRRTRERERNKALVQHALTQHLCLSWFQMNKAEYQVAHLYAAQRQIDQSITAGCCWITNALWCLCAYVCIRQLFSICCALNASVCMNIEVQYVQQCTVPI